MSTMASMSPDQPDSDPVSLLLASVLEGVAKELLPYLRPNEIQLLLTRCQRLSRLGVLPSDLHKR